MNDDEPKQAAKKARYAEKAKQLEAEAQTLYEYDCKLMSGIPLGQPILEGHHSEKSHRALLNRSHQRMDKICALTQKAEHYHHLATSKNRAISLDDEDALSKLEHKLMQLGAYQQRMKETNREYRKQGIEAINGAEIRRIKRRMAELETKAQQVPREAIQGKGYGKPSR